MFGKTQRGVSDRPNKPKKSLIPAWLGTLIIILMILCFGLALLLWKPWEPVKPQSDTTVERAQEDTNHDYRFYDLLPQQQVTPIPEQAIPENKGPTAVVIVEAPQTAPIAASEAGLLTEPKVPAKTSFILQVRSYNNPDAADARRAEIILNGLSADVIKTVENGETWYRVISGPYESQQAAIIAQQTLQNSGIDSIVIKH
ncbi:cell division protein [Acinetobacter sp. ANC 4558]|uniref:SPOR domain-containing protein n=1 Tax=Acinetobacter sp. ANC 4558 TaxID=1977876 RepID=UPI000A3337BD|nr:SPOR domain-containing protein [Acinetobacter sp. ANC 4558]OTG86772.1 cell division protein [Acinetobacter sp. ANC 4558]